MSVTLNDYRQNRSDKTVWEAVLDQITWNNPDHDLRSEDIDVVGTITQIVWSLGSGGAAAPNVVLNVKDSEGNLLFTTTEAHNQTVIDYAGGDFALGQLSGQGFTIEADPAVAPTVIMVANIVVRGI